MIPLPMELGAPAQFDAWRPHQPDAVLAIADAPTRFTGCVLPTGAGKTLTVVSAALLAGWRTCFLTSTKMLQDQYQRDMASIGMVDVRGQGSYQCVAFLNEHTHLRDRAWQGCDEGPCRAGHACALKPKADEQGIEKGCHSYDAIARAWRADLVVTNYKRWLHQQPGQSELGRFDCLVLDEAHHAPNELADYLSTVLEPGDFELLGAGGPSSPLDAHAWAEWAKIRAHAVTKALTQVPRSRAELRIYRQLRGLNHKLQTLADMKGHEWIVTQDGESMHFDPVWVQSSREKLFRGVPHVVCTSATFTHKTAAMLGIDHADLTWHEAPSDFPVERRPVYYVPCVKMDYRADESQIRLWLATIDNVLRQRRDRKGILHAVSYQRMNLIAQHSEFKHEMITHDRRNTRDAVAQFKAAGPGAILVSPSVTTGYDFPMAECEYQVIVKIPFPDSRSPVVKARSATDPNYAAYIAMQELVQAVGRGMRSADDQCECFVLDNNCSWFMKKHRDLAPTWFLAAYQRAETLPEAPPALSAGAC